MAEIPATIGRYDVVGVLGRGAMGTVYRAHDPDIDRPVAIKLIQAELLDNDGRDRFITRFRREAQAAARCAHPNIVAIYDFGLHGDNPFLAMEFVDGPTLEQLRRDLGRFSIEDAVFLMLQVLAALEGAHGTGVVHRDIKPANIILSGGNHVKVTDFGISRLETADLTAESTVIGTPSYMSPEQWIGQAADARSDLFSASVVLYEMLAGAKPFPGSSSAQVMHRLLNEPAPDLSLVAPELPAEVCALVSRGLSKAREDRFASAAEMAAALRAAATNTGTAYTDRTIVRPSRPALALASESTGGSVAFDDELLNTLQRALSEHIGPIARQLVQRAARKADSLTSLYESVATAIDAPASRIVFLEQARKQVAASNTSLTAKPSAVPATIPATGMERLQTELARHVGPLARILIKRASAGASGRALWSALSVHIADPKARAAFLSSAPP
jgi:serine/threonine-protein kinase